MENLGRVIFCGMFPGDPQFVFHFRMSHNILDHKTEILLLATNVKTEEQWGEDTFRVKCVLDTFRVKCVLYKKQ